MRAFLEQLSMQQPAEGEAPGGIAGTSSGVLLPATSLLGGSYMGHRLPSCPSMQGTPSMHQALASLPSLARQEAGEAAPPWAFSLPSVRSHSGQSEITAAEKQPLQGGGGAAGQEG
jgi:hypothetical protein